MARRLSARPQPGRRRRVESPQQPKTAAHRGEELNMYSLTYDRYVDSAWDLAIDLNLPIRTDFTSYSVIFDTEADLIAFRDLVEELYNV